MERKLVLLLDDDADLRMLVCELFVSEGAGCVGVGSLDEMKTLGATGSYWDIAILDVNLGGGQPSGVEAYLWLREQSFSGRIVFLTGHARSFPGVAEAYALGVTVLEKPVPISCLVSLLHEPRAS
jgi:DNA-binding response OmpR family regulator